MDRCRSCDAPIIWAETARSKKMPVNAEPSRNGNIRVVDSRAVPGTMFADVLAGNRLMQARAVGDPLHESHFSTCPDARKFRR